MATSVDESARSAVLVADGPVAAAGVDSIALGVALADGLGDPSVVPPVSFGPGPSR